MRVAEIMTTEVLTVSPTTSLKEVGEALLGRGISGIPVVGAGREVLGVVSETDIVFKERRPDTHRARFLIRLANDDEELKLEARTAGEAMTMPPITIAADRPVSEAASLMLDRGVNRLPVVDREGVLVGIVTRSDLVRAFVRPDEEIAREIREHTLIEDLWLDPDRFKLEVERGEVTITGDVDSEYDADILKRWIKLVPGVVAVDARLQVVSR
jgi:CBS domain-containing protein